MTGSGLAVDRSLKSVHILSGVFACEWAVAEASLIKVFSHSSYLMEFGSPASLHGS